MARVKLTEFRSKSLLIKDYSGIEIKAKSIAKTMLMFDAKKKYIIKVDQGVKKRGKQGLVQINVTKTSAKEVVTRFAKQGYERFIAEPMVVHDESEERYFSIERVREGFRILYSQKGGVDIEEHTKSVAQYSDIRRVPLPRDFMTNIVNVMNKENLSFIEINPLLVRDNECILLDAAVLADSAGIGLSSWTEDDIVEARQKSHAEYAVEELNSNSPASFSLRLLNQDGRIWLLLSGGGASITIADEAANVGKAKLIGNFGEYSGGPTREETQLYTKALLDCVIKSNAKTKAIVIGGGVANFTDVKKTFAGIIDTLEIYKEELKKQKVRVFVRRGGPNEEEGLTLMRTFLKKHNIYGSVHGSDVVLTLAVDEALKYVDV